MRRTSSSPSHRALPGSLLAIFCSAALAAGCGSDDDPSPTSAQSSSGAGAQGGSGAEGGSGGASNGGNGNGGGGAPAGSLDVLVTDATEDGAPVVGALCVLVAPGGQTTDGTTDAQGRIAFEGLDWALGKAAVTCVFEFSAYSMVDVDQAYLDAQGEVQFVRPTPIPPKEYVEVSGQLLNPTDANHTFLVSSDNSFWQNFGADYEVVVEQGQPFDLVAAEFTSVQNPAPHGFGQQFFEWATVHSDGLDADATQDIDFTADALTPQTVTASVPIPTSPKSIFRNPNAYGSVYVTPLDDRYGAIFLGFGTSTAYDETETRLEYDAEYVEAVVDDDGAVTLHVLFEGYQLEDGVSYWLSPGYPTSADFPDSFLDAPRLFEPPASGASLVGAVMQWAPDGETPTALQIAGETYTWYVRTADATATSMTVPALPSSVNGFELFGGSVRAAFMAEGPLLPQDFYEQLAISHAVTLAP